MVVRKVKMRKRTKKKKKRKKRKEEAAKREREKKRKRIPKWKANPQLKSRVGFRPVFFFFPALTSFLSSLAHTLSHSSFPHTADLVDMNVVPLSLCCLLSTPPDTIAICPQLHYSGAQLVLFHTRRSSLPSFHARCHVCANSFFTPPERCLLACLVHGSQPIAQSSPTTLSPHHPYIPSFQLEKRRAHMMKFTIFDVSYVMESFSINIAPSNTAM